MSFVRSGVIAWRHWSGQTLEERDSRRDVREAALLLAAAAFIFSNAVAYSFLRESTITWSHLFAPACWLVVVTAAHLTIRIFRPTRDPFLLPVFALLAGWGLLLQDRLAPNFLGRQTLWFTLATVAMLAVVIIPRTLQPLLRYRYVLLLGGIVLLAVTLLFGVNPGGSGIALWLPVPFPFLGRVYFQPSELLKLLLVIFLASYFTEQAPLHNFRREAVHENSKGRSFAIGAFLRHLPFLGPLLAMWGFTILLLVWQQDLGAAALFFIVFVTLVYLATGEWVYVWSGLILLLLAGVFAFFAFDTVVAPRILSWLNPWPNVSDRAYQIVQALYAQAAGGIIGKGIGQGFPDYIPVVHSDFALAAVAEEWGEMGSLTVVACFAILAGRGLRTTLLSIRGARPNFFHAYLGAGLVTLLSVQAFLIMGGTTRLLPLTGITLPFVSYGGSSLLVSSLAIGLLLFLSAAADPAPPAPPADRGLARRLEHLGILLLLIFSVVALTLTYWTMIRGISLLARVDNPRLVEAERRVLRGRILDKDGAILAESPAIGGSPAAGDRPMRIYPIPEAGPAVGYYSWRFGTAGIENAFDAHLRGRDDTHWARAIRELLNKPQAGNDVRLTLDGDLQAAATTLMAENDLTGGLVLLELVEIDGEAIAEVRAIVSLPGYDPNKIDEQFESLTADDPGPLFDRAAQGLYQPGLILQPMIVASAIESEKLKWEDPVTNPFLPIVIDGQVQRCMTPRDEVATLTHTWAEMIYMRCPRPLYDLGHRLGAETLDMIFNRFGLHGQPDLPIPTNSNATATTDAGLAAIGQSSLTVTPLQAALATAVLAGDGRLPGPRLVEAISETNGQWATLPAGASPSAQPVVLPQTALETRAVWPEVAGVREFAVSVLAGPDGGRNSWFLGMAPATKPRFVVALVLEGETRVDAAERIGRGILNLATGP